MAKIEIDCNNRGLFSNAIARMRANDPSFADVFFQYPNAEDALDISSVLKTNTIIHTIDISHANYFDALGAEYMADALKVNRSITSFSLRVSNIGDEGAIAIADALRVNKFINSIDLAYNGITDIGAISFSNALAENHILTDINLNNNLIGPGALGRVLVHSGRNAAILHKAVEDFIEDRELTERQLQIIESQNRSKDSGIFGILSRDVRDRVRDKFSTSMDKIGRRLKDPALMIDDFLSPANDLSAIQAVGDRGRGGKSPADGYFRGQIAITHAIHQSFNQMLARAGDLLKAVNAPNNAIFIADALKKGVSFEQINENLEKIKADPSAHQFALSNPKKLGYLMTLEGDKLDKAIGILSHPKLGEFVRANPTQIAILLKVSDDPEKLLRAVKEINANPNIRSVKMAVTVSNERYAESSKKAASASRGGGRG